MLAGDKCYRKMKRGKGTAMTGSYEKAGVMGSDPCVCLSASARRRRRRHRGE